MLKTEKKMPFLTNKEFVFFFNWEILVKKFVDSYSENSWKHVVNSIIAMISQASEFQQLKVRDDEMDELDDLTHEWCQV